MEGQDASVQKQPTSRISGQLKNIHHLVTDYIYTPIASFILNIMLTTEFHLRLLGMSSKYILFTWILINYIFYVPVSRAYVMSSGMLEELTTNLDASEVALTTTLQNNSFEQLEASCLANNQELVSPIQGQPRCCSKCPQGSGMLRLCTDTQDTQCSECELGSEFSSSSSATNKCKQCRRCSELHSEAVVRKACTQTEDTICGCKPGFFSTGQGQTCSKCSECAPGQGVVRPCEWNADTVCQVCPAGFWSSRVSGSIKCIPCKQCNKQSEIESQSCSTINDTLCCPIDNPNCTVSYNSQFVDSIGSSSDTSDRNPVHESIQSQLDSQSDSVETSIVNPPPATGLWIKLPTNNTSYAGIKTSFRLDDYPLYKRRQIDDDSTTESVGQNQMLPIYCSLMGLIIIALLFYVVYKLWKQRGKGSIAKLKLNDNDGYHPVGSDVKVKRVSPSTVRGQMRDPMVWQYETTRASPSSISPATTSGQDRQPLLLIPPSYTPSERLEIGNSVKIAQPLSTVPVQDLAMLCSKFSQSSWSELLSVMNIDQTTLSNTDHPISSPPPTLTRMLSLTTSSVDQSDDLSNRINQLHQLVFVRSVECPNIGQFAQALIAVNRADLLPLLGIADQLDGGIKKQEIGV